MQDVLVFARFNLESEAYGALAPSQGTSHAAPARAGGSRVQFHSLVPHPGPVRPVPVGPRGLGPCPLHCLQLGFVLWGGAPPWPPAPARYPGGPHPGCWGQARPPPHAGRPLRSQGGPLLHARPWLPERGGAASLLSCRASRLRPSLTSVPRQRIGCAGNPSAIRCPCSGEERPRLARSTGFLQPAPPELRN
ncbi:hypothetical protein NDU88_000166 [Pleurodeles waltl]|uniref:Uncharacterized protein n=1 Tax=Pleurodeles waltl TaxID=8319 RepID=A0AAV7UTA5_PLEWA|nr:hypothetical protein NDU88_000166 [Pleurodeles waltl]